jgi:hypothetical protein
MIKIRDNSNIYVLCPENYVTGGTELLHQLVHTLLTYNKNAFIVYFNISSYAITNAEVPAEFAEYLINRTTHIDDTKDNVLVLSETVVQKVAEFKNVQLILWWLSVNSFYSSSKDFLSIRDYFIWKPRSAVSTARSRYIKGFGKSRNPFTKTISISDIANLPILNCYQSEFAHHFLLTNNFSEVLPLTDFLNDNYIQAANETEPGPKQNAILYNPKKGIKFTKKLIEASPNLNWVPLINMSRKEVVQRLKTSKLYVDFGEHPGKDRIPREAVISGCCLVTGLQGSAKFFEDVSIEEFYKIDERKTSIESIITKLDKILNNYSYHYSNFAYYRSRIIKERERFEEQVREIFSIDTKPKFEIKTESLNKHSSPA